MIRILMTGAALLAAAPVFAHAGSAVQDPAAPAGAAAAGSAVGTEQDATTANPAASSADSSTQVASVVDSEFPVYDADKSGQLDKAEFSKWILALKEQEMKSTGKTMPQAELTAWASAAFATADADKSSGVTKAELTGYLGG